jgi:tetratricopeptide (TPR) repeat protein
MLLALLSLSCALGTSGSIAAHVDAADATVKRDLRNCREHANIDACYDAIRWKPDDAILQVALGDALSAARRPADALRAYRRAAEIAPDKHGIAAKISRTEAKLSSPREQPTGPTATALPTVPIVIAKRYSNVEPAAQSH